MTKLEKLCEDLHTTHKTIADAVTALAAELKSNAELRNLAALFVLQRTKPSKPRSRRREGPKQSPRSHRLLPTPAQKIANIRADKQIAAGIFSRKLRGGRLLGTIRVHELRAFAEESANNASSFLNRGFDDAVDAVAFGLMAKHCVAADPTALVPEIINERKASHFYEQAKRMAAEKISEHASRIARDLTSSELPAS